MNWADGEQGGDGVFEPLPGRLGAVYAPVVWSGRRGFGAHVPPLQSTHRCARSPRRQTVPAVQRRTRSPEAVPGTGCYRLLSMPVLARLCSMYLTKRPISFFFFALKNQLVSPLKYPNVDSFLIHFWLISVCTRLISINLDAFGL